MTPETQAKLLEAAKQALVELDEHGQRSKTRYQFLRDAITMAEKEQIIEEITGQPW